MMCDNLKAYLDGELGLLYRMIMSAHVRMCAECRCSAAEWQRLSRDIEQLEDAPVPPALRGKLMADAMTAAAEARTRVASPVPQWKRAQGVWKMRKALVASVIAVTLLVAGLWLLPRQQDGSAIAAMAKAMAQVDTVHFTGFALDANGEKRRLEGWVKGANRIRIRVDGERDIADDGTRLVAVEWGDLRKVTIRFSGALPGLAKGLTYLDLFNGPGSLRSAIETNGAQVIEAKRIALPGGREGRVTELVSDSSERMRIFIDAATCLLVRAETYSRSGALIEVIERVEYNVPVADSLFKMGIPASMPVLDLVSRTPDDVTNDRKAEFERLQADPNARMLVCGTLGRGRGGGGSSCGTWCHPDFRFEIYGPGFTSIHYLADRNVYRILGRARAYNVRQNWHSDIIENGDIRLPGEPQIEDVLMLNGRIGDYCGKDMGPYRIQNIGPGPATVTYHKGKNVYIIRGRTKLLPTGKSYTDAVVKLDTRYGRDLAKYVDQGGKLDWGGVPADEMVRMNSKMLAARDSRQAIAESASRDDTLNWGPLPPQEIESMKADLDVALRLAELEKNSRGGRIVINGAPVQASYGGGSSPRVNMRFEVAGPGTLIRVLEIPSRREFHVLGRARIEPLGITVKNAVVTYDGEVLSSEE